MPKVRIMHYMNQFFAGVGGEDKADTPVSYRQGVAGPGKRLQDLLGDSAEIVVTVYCGDNYFAPNSEEALALILEIAKKCDVRMLVAGPAFASGRHGFACAEVCHTVSTSLGLYCVTAMSPDNPGVDRYRNYKNDKVYLLPTAGAVSGMEEALKRMAQFVSKLAAGTVIGPPSEEGYIPRGIRRDAKASKSGAERVIDMLLNKMAGHPFITEIPVASVEAVPAAPRITNLKESCLALATTAGIIRPGNPDGFKGHRNTQWRKYPIDELNSMKDTRWDVLHGGYNNAFMYSNPNYGVPLDVCRELEKEGVFARLYPYFYGTTGVDAMIPVMQAIGKEMVVDMKAEGVDAVILVST